MKWFSDMIFDSRAGGTHVIGGVHKWVINSNWKLPADNFTGDGYHTYLTHASLRAIRESNGPISTQRFGEGGWSISPGNGHGVIRFGSGGYGSRKPSDPLPKDTVQRYRIEHLP